MRSTLPRRPSPKTDAANSTDGRFARRTVERRRRRAVGRRRRLVSRGRRYLVLIEYVATEPDRPDDRKAIELVLAAPPPTPEKEIAQAAELRAMLVKRKRDDFDIDDFDSHEEGEGEGVHCTLPDSSEFVARGDRQQRRIPRRLRAGAAARALRDLFGATSALRIRPPSSRSRSTARRRRLTTTIASTRARFVAPLRRRPRLFGEDRAAAEAPTRRRRGTAAGRRRTRRQRPRRSSHLHLLAQTRIPEERAN